MTVEVFMEDNKGSDLSRRSEKSAILVLLGRIRISRLPKYWVNAGRYGGFP